MLVVSFLSFFLVRFYLLYFLSFFFGVRLRFFFLNSYFFTHLPSTDVGTSSTPERKKKWRPNNNRCPPPLGNGRKKEKKNETKNERKKERKRGRKKVDRFFSDRLDTQPLATANESSVIFLRPVKKRKRRLLGR